MYLLVGMRINVYLWTVVMVLVKLHSCERYNMTWKKWSEL